MAHFFGSSFYHPTRLSPIYKPRPMLLPFDLARVVFGPFCVCRPFVSYFLLCFLRPCTCNHLLSPSRTLRILLVTVLCCFNWFFSFLWLPKRAHPHLLEIFLCPTSIRSTSTSLKQPNLHPFRMLPRLYASACLSHSSGSWILDSGAFDHLSVTKVLFSSLTITSPLPMITLVNKSQTMAKGISSACPFPFIPPYFCPLCS